MEAGIRGVSSLGTGDNLASVQLQFLFLIQVYAKMKPQQKWIKFVGVPAAFVETIDFGLFGESDYIKL